MTHQIKIKDSFTANQDDVAVVQQGDTLSICSKLPSNTFSLVITSPPYNIGKIYENSTSLDDYLSSQSKIISELVRITKNEGSVVWQVGNYVEKGEIFPLDIYFYPIFKKLGLKLRNRIIWHFGHGLHASKRFSGRYETLLWFTKSDQYIFNLDAVRVPSKYPGKRHYKGEKKGQPSCNPLGKNPSDFWEDIKSEFDTGVIEIPNVKSNHPEKTIHPCQYPVELVERCVHAFTNENDWVIDPFSGVGSSIIASIKNNRKGMGIEKEKNYCDITKDRIKKLISGELKTREIGTTVFKPTGKEKVSRIPDEWITHPRS